MTTTIIVPTVVNSMGYDEWWCPCGITPSDCIAAYLAKGAASYAVSKINLANPGTYDADDTGHAPDWDDVNGWKFDGVSEYLDTGVSDNPYPDNYTMIVRYSNYILSDAGSTICGINDNLNTFRIGSYDYLAGTDWDSYGYGETSFVSIEREPYTSNGIRAVVGCTACYRNGVLESDATYNGFILYTPVNIYIGCEDYAGDSPSGFSNIYIQAFALYNKRLTSSQIYDLTLSMQAL